MTTYCAMCPTWEIKNPDRCSNTIVRKGKTVYFCTKRCREKFEKAEKAPSKRGKQK